MAQQFVQVDIRGLEQVFQRLTAVSSNTQKKYLKTAMRAGATVVKRAAVRNAKLVDDPSTSEKIWKNITVQFASKASRRPGFMMFRVGVRGGAKQRVDNAANRRGKLAGKTYAVGGSSSNPGGDTWYWRFLELGVPKRGITPREFMLRGLRSTTQRATDTVANSLTRQLDKGVVK